MSRSVRNCGKCGGSLTVNEIRAARPFPCPHCGIYLQAVRSYGDWITGANLLLLASILFGLGVRGVHLTVGIALGFWVVEWAAFRVVKYVVPPTIEVAAPPKSLRQTVREIYARSELNLSDKKGRTKSEQNGWLGDRPSPQRPEELGDTPKGPEHG